MATSTLGSGTLVLAGTTSGTTTVTATAVAGTTTLTLPAATDTLVGKATTDTLTNKTLTGAAMNGTLGATTPSTGAFTTTTASTSSSATIFYPTVSSGTGIQMTSTGNNNGNWTIANNYGQMTVATEGTAGSLVTGSSQGAALFGNASNVPAQFFTNNTVRATLDISGNLGLGVTPSAWWSSFKALQVNNSSFGTYLNRAYVSANWYVDSTVTSKYIASDYATQYVQENGSHIWYNAPTGTAGNAITFTQAMTLDASGNLLVGTTSASGRLTVHAQSGVAPCYFKVFTNGDAGIFFANASNAIVGQVTVNSASTAYVTSSDYRLKNTIAPMTGALAKVALLKPCTYKWNVDESDGDGFIAHELQAIVPDAVVGEKDALNEDGSIKPQGIDTSFLVATLTAAIQEQQALITQLTARITALEGA